MNIDYDYVSAYFILAGLIGVTFWALWETIDFGRYLCRKKKQ